jgi:hypothetical protein
MARLCDHDYARPTSAADFSLLNRAPYDLTIRACQEFAEPTLSARPALTFPAEIPDRRLRASIRPCLEETPQPESVKNAPIATPTFRTRKDDTPISMPRPIHEIGTSLTRYPVRSGCNPVSALIANPGSRKIEILDHLASYQLQVIDQIAEPVE